ncbi:MAG: AtpZ/AtpI family protein [Bacteroidales bacterium]|nr:AtpZ/AtpI family protein [Lentimicrobiaceae bacterium]MDD5694949.1 AtpZ/AtpI family protein [Bacteroidales bacterium]
MSKKKSFDNFIRYSSISSQMLVIILVGIYGGVKLDKLIKLDFPVFTVILSFVSVALAIYYAVKDFIKTK